MTAFHAGRARVPATWPKLSRPDDLSRGGRGRLCCRVAHGRLSSQRPKRCRCPLPPVAQGSRARDAGGRLDQAGEIPSWRFVRTRTPRPPYDVGASALSRRGLRRPAPRLHCPDAGVPGRPGAATMGQLRSDLYGARAARYIVLALPGFPLRGAWGCSAFCNPRACFDRVRCRNLLAGPPLALFVVSLARCTPAAACFMRASDAPRPCRLAAWLHPHGKESL